MYTGGIDYRKNVEGLIRAYAGLQTEIRETHQLAIVCSVQKRDRRRLIDLGAEKGLKPNDLITGFIPDDDLVDLYNLCTVFVFPSFHEGFGLPDSRRWHAGRRCSAAIRPVCRRLSGGTMRSSTRMMIETLRLNCLWC